MKVRNIFATGLMVLTVALPATQRLASARDGREFTGYYGVTGAQESDGQVRLTLSLRLFNNSGADVKDATILVHSWKPGPVNHATFAIPVQWRDRAAAGVSREMSLPAEEYQDWLVRGQPNVFVVYRDAAGREWTRPAQLIRRPVIPTAH